MKRNFLSCLVLVAILCLAISSLSCAAAESQQQETYDIDYLVLVNKENKLPDDWEERVHLSSATSASGKEIFVETEALEKYYELRNALAEEDDIYILLDSTYRSVAYQEDLARRFTEEYGEEYVKQYVAVPGYSEHHTGLAIDVCLRIGNTIIDDNDEMIAQREIFTRVHQRLADFGFILRYQEGKEDVTGYAYEPWHLRYVGSAEIAHEIMDGGYTLEEYLANLHEMSIHKLEPYDESQMKISTP